jgi:hypothetical protein
MRPTGRDPLSPSTGVVVAGITAAGGLVLRRGLWDRGTALSFVIVTAVFLGAAFTGWRAAAVCWRSRHR